MKTKKIVMTALFAALVCVATMAIKIPTFYGYVNLGDCIVLLSGWILGPAYGFLAASIGSAVADLIGYPLYAPATFVIKGLMAVAAACVLKGNTKLFGRIISGICAEIIMIAGYYIFEGFLYGFGPALVSIPTNAGQGVAGIVAGIILIKISAKFKKNINMS